MLAAHARSGYGLSSLGEGVLLVLVLGSTLVIAKGALHDIGPLTLAALRYCVAAVVLLPLVVWRRAPGWSWRRQPWHRLAAIGIGFYALGNGALFLGLRYVPAATASLLLALVPVVVLAGGMIWLGERATRFQLLGIALALCGAVLFFARGLGPGEPLGLAILVVGVLGSASLTILGRPLARSGQSGTLSLTAVPLTIGGLVLLPIALAVEGAPCLSVVGWATVMWLALVNTAFAYVLYNHVLRSLAAFETSALASLSPVVTAIGGWLVLAEPLAAVQVIGMGLTVGGVVLVQLRRRGDAS